MAGGNEKQSEYRDYGFPTAEPSHMFERFIGPVIDFAEPLTPDTRVLDVGCGNGAVCGEFIRRGCSVVGVDLSAEGIAIARKSYPTGRFEVIAADDDILERLEEAPFDVVVSTEVVEHLYAPRKWARACYEALRPGGTFICTTPYHGYAKNLVLSLLGEWDTHANPLWDGGHIKLWSRRTLTSLLEEAGLSDIAFRGVGRFPGLWMTMIVAAARPE